MEILKFRVWNIKDKRFIKNFVLADNEICRYYSTANDELREEKYFSCFAFDNNDLVVQYSINYRDIYDRLIYDGDVLKVNYGEEIFNIKIEDIFKDHFIVRRFSNIEIVGNRFQNPEIWKTACRVSVSIGFDFSGKLRFERV